MSDQSDARRKAVALKYDGTAGGSAGAPKVVAKGAGFVADKILALAEEHGVSVHEDKDLVEVLSALELGEEIPDDLYEVVAKLLAEIYRLNGKFGS
jgi:flagellar biosynthesis protein